MTQTTTTPAQQAAETELGDTAPIHPADVLLHLIIMLLAPLFLDASGGNVAFARMAALDTVNAYRIRHNADLIAVAQIIAFGLAALGSLSLSMADDVSVSMALRLRGNANALNRSAEQNRRALKQDRPSAHAYDTCTQAEPSDAEYEASVLQAVAAIQPAAPPRQPKPAATQATPPAAPSPATRSATPSPATSSSAAQPQDDQPQDDQPQGDQPQQALWAAAMAKVAAEVAASLPGLPPQERRAASIRAAALCSTANELMCGTIPPRPRPGDLDAMFRPKAA